MKTFHKLLLNIHKLFIYSVNSNNILIFTSVNIRIHKWEGRMSTEGKERNSKTNNWGRGCSVLKSSHYFYASKKVKIVPYTFLHREVPVREDTYWQMR